MKCTKCGHENSAGHDYCEECGAKLSSVNKCKNCGHENKPNHKFCEECGEKVSGSKLLNKKYVIVGGILIVLIVASILAFSIFKKPQPAPIDTEKSSLAQSNDTAPQQEAKKDYIIEEQKSKEVTLPTKQNSFILSSSEYTNMDKATLNFIPYCGNANDLGTLSVFVNNKEVFASTPACDNAYRQIIPKNILNQGENILKFQSSKGSYSVEQIKITPEFIEPQVKTYYFEIDSSTFNHIRDGSKNVKLTLKFVDDKRKRTKLNVNGHVETIDTDNTTFSKSIDSKVSSGNNFVRLEPLEDLEVVELKVYTTDGNVLLIEYPGILSATGGLEGEKKLQNIFLVPSQEKAESIDCNSLNPGALIWLKFDESFPQEVLDNGRTRFRAKLDVISSADDTIKNIHARMIGFDPLDFGTTFEQLTKDIENLNSKDSMTIMYPLIGEFTAADLMGNTEFTFRADVSFDYKNCKYKHFIEKKVIVKS